jgi:hypothetical protein
MKEGDYGYIIHASKIRPASVLTVSTCGRYFNAYYHVGGKAQKSLMHVSAFYTSEFDAREALKKQQHEVHHA